MSRRRRFSKRHLWAACALAVTLSGCGGPSPTSSGAPDPAATQAPLPLPNWYPPGFVAPSGAVVVEAIDSPEAGQGRSVTWRLDETFESVEKKVENSFASLGWKPTEKLTDANKGGSTGTRRTSWFIENGSVYAIRLFRNDALAGVRLTVELPAGS